MAAPDAQIMTQEQAAQQQAEANTQLNALLNQQEEAQQQAAEIGQGNNANTATGPLDILGATQTQSAALSGEQQPSQNNIWQAAATQVQNNPYLLGGYPQVNPNIVRMAGQQNQGPLDVLGVTQPQATAMPTEQQLAPIAEQQAPVTPQPQMVQAPETAQATETAPKNQPTVKFSDHDGKVHTTPVAYKIVPMESLNISNTDSGGINPNYPQQLQPRERSRFADMVQVDGIAKNLEPKMLDTTEEISSGSPITDTGSNIVSGNGRAMAIRKAYNNPELAETSGKKYRDFVQQRAKDLGLNISNIKNPVLIRELQDDTMNGAIAELANVPNVAGMSASEQARVDAKKLTPEILSTYTDGDLDGINGSSQFIRSFQDKAVAKSQMADFMDKDGKVSQNGLRRIKAALVAKAYGDSSVLGRMSESTDDNMKNITNALTLAAPHMAFVQNKMDNGTLDEKYSIQKPLYEAVSELEDLRKNNGNVADVLNQSNLFGPQMSDAAKTLLQFMDANKRKPNNIRQLLNDYAAAVEDKGDPKQKNMFETEPETVNGLLNRMIKKQGLTVSGESVGEKQQGKLDFYEGEKKPGKYDVGYTYEDSIGTREIYRVKDGKYYVRTKGSDEPGDIYTKDELESKIKEAPDNIKRRDRIAKEQETRKQYEDSEKKAQEEYKKINGFVDGKSDMEKGRILKALDKDTKIDDRIMTRRKFIEDSALNKNASSDILNGNDYIIRGVYGDNRFKEVTKIEYDYFNYLRDNPKILDRLGKKDVANTETTYSAEVGNGSYYLGSHIVEKDKDGNILSDNYEIIENGLSKERAERLARAMNKQTGVTAPEKQEEKPAYTLTHNYPQTELDGYEPEGANAVVKYLDMVHHLVALRKKGTPLSNANDLTKVVAPLYENAIKEAKDKHLGISESIRDISTLLARLANQHVNEDMYGDAESGIRKEVEYIDGVLESKQPKKEESKKSGGKMTTETEYRSEDNGDGTFNVVKVVTTKTAEGNIVATQTRSVEDGENLTEDEADTLKSELEAQNSATVPETKASEKSSVVSETAKNEQEGNTVRGTEAVKPKEEVTQNDTLDNSPADNIIRQKDLTLDKFTKSDWKQLPTPQLRLAKMVFDELSKGSQIQNNVKFARMADEAWGGTQGQGAYEMANAYDAMELGVNMYIRDKGLNPSGINSKENLLKMMDDIKTTILDKLPTMNSRSDDKIKYQQFSTPPNYSALANWLLASGKSDMVLEPSAGIGGLAVFAKNSGADVVVNEFAKNRIDTLKAMGFDRVFTENAEQINNILPNDVQPSRVVMNPPFSSSGDRGTANKTKNAEAHITQALLRLKDGGRAVIILGKGMADDAPAFKKFWDGIKQDYNVRANVELSGKDYAKYGTTFGNVMVVVDKTGATPKTADGKWATVTGKYDSIADAINKIYPALEAIHNDGRNLASAETSGAGRQNLSGRDQQQGGRKSQENNGAAQNSVQLDGQSANESNGGKSGGTAGGNIGTQTGGREAVRQSESNRPAGERTSSTAKRGNGESGTAGGVSVGHAGREGISSGERPEGVSGNGGSDTGEHAVRTASDSTGEPERSVQSDRPGDGGEGSVKLKSKEEIIKEQQKARPAEKDDNATFTHYVSPVAGPEHPADLDEPDAMASVKAPSIAVKLKLDNKILTDGSLSAPQQEIIARAIQSFDKKINEGIPDAEARQGFFIGDGTGVGKGREISGIIMDQLNRGVGNGKAIWISKDHDLVNDARRDWMGLGGKESDIISQEAETTNGKQLDNNSKGVLFTAYSYFSRDPQTIKKGRDRIKEIQDWLGKDFDGVIALDEAHTVNNVLDKKTARGSKKGARSATAIQDLLDAFPNARVVYATATGETEVENLAMLSRLPLWGMRTAFKTMDDFMAKMKSGGTSAMELVARDMKAMGVYLARSLSFRSGKYSDENVTYSRLEHTLNDNQRAIYNEVATGYQVVLENVHKAMLMTGATKWNGSQFYGSMQRCFNQILTSMSIPSVIQSIENDLKEGHSAVIQITNTNEAELKRAAAKLREGDTVDDLDLTPKDTLIDYVRDYFPIQVWEDYIDDNGNHAKRPAVDSEGKPVIDQQAVRMRDALIDRLDSIRFPDSPLDTIIKHFGIANVAEITGRTVRPNYEHKSDKILIPISDKARQVEAKAFQNGDKKILIFSEAGGTGFSYHADKTKKNQQKRIHYLLQPGWKAAAAIQGLGRTNRSNQAHKPHIVLVTTDVPGQKRFISTIARRLEQLGALTQGDRGAQNNGIFNERDNIESQQAQKALDSLIANLDSDTLKRMGLDGDVKANKQIPISKFLNRLLAINLEEQSDIFQEFNDNLDHEIKVATDNGTLDTGTKNLRADSIIEKNNEVVYKDGGIETRYVELDTANRQEPRRFTQRDETGFIGFYLQKQANDGKGRVVQVYSKNTVTDPRTGKVLKNYSTLGVDPAFRDTVLESKLNNTDTYEKLDETTARKLWSQETNTLPNMKHITRHIITGAILPIYNQLELDNGGTVYNIRLDDGTSMLGLNIPAKKISRVLSNLASFSGRSHKVDSDAIIRDVLDNGSRYTFANGWQLKRASVHGEFRAELVGPDFTAERAVDGFGVLKERIEGRQRFFVPANRSMTLDMLRKYSPLKTDNNSAYRIVDAQKAEAVKNITAAGLRASVRGAQVFDRGNGKFILEFKNGNKWVIDTQAESIPINPAIVKRDYGRDVNANDLAVGRTRVINGKTFIDLVAGLSGPKTYGHELFEAAWRQMTKAEREACIKDYGSKENSAERFGDLLNDRLGKLTKRTTAIFQRIRDFFANIRAKLFGPKSEDVFRAIESGAIMNRDTEQTGNEESYRLADKAPQTPQEAAERLSQEQKDAKAEATTKAPKVVQDAIKGLQLEGMVAPPTGKKRSLTIKERWHKFYSNQIDELHPLFQTFGRDFYEKASNALYGIGSKAQFRILYGDDTKTGAKGLKQIYDMIPAEQHSGFSYYALLKHLRDVSKMSYDAADRIEEIKKELDNTFDEEHATSLKLEMAGLARLQKIVKARPEVYDEALRKIEEKFPNWKAPQQELVKYNRSLLNLISDTGIISKKLHDELLKRYPNYVPLQRDFGEESGLDNFVRTRGLVNVANPLKTLRGSERDVIDPLDQIIRNTFAFESVAARQQVARDIVDRYDAGDLEGIIEETDNVHHGKDESVFYVYEDGKKRLFRTDKDIYNALVMSVGGAKNDKDNLYLKIAKAPAAALRAGTTHSITFGIGNIFRDTFAYGVVGKEFRPIIDTVNGFLALATDEALVKDFMKNGGVQEMSWLSNDKRNELISMLKERKTWKDNAVVKYNPISLYWKLSGAFAEMSEQASRLGQYKRLLEKGYDKEKAIFETRDNMNFMRAGVYGKTINQFVSFYNASIQGVDKLCRTLYHDGKFDRKALMRGLMYLTAASMAVSFYNYGDDDRKKKYLNLAPWRKNMFWNFIIGDEVFSIPKPFEAGMIFASLPERFMDYLYQKDKRAFDRVGESFMSSLTPEFTPTILTTYLELAHNYSGFYGRQIVPDSEKDLDADLQYGPYQAEWAKDITKITKYFPEFAGIPFLDTVSKTMRSPRMLEYAVLNMGGAGAKDYSDIYNRLSRGFKGETRPAEDMINTLPGIRKLFADAKYGGRDQEAFRKEIEDLSGKLKSAEERYGRGQVADLTPKDIRTLQLSANIKYVNSFISNQKEGINAALKAERQIMTAQGMSAQQKKEQIDRLNAYILAVSREGLDRIDEIQKYINTDRKEGEQ